MPGTSFPKGFTKLPRKISHYTGWPNEYRGLPIANEITNFGELTNAVQYALLAATGGSTLYPWQGQEYCVAYLEYNRHSHDITAAVESACLQVNDIVNTMTGDQWVEKYYKQWIAIMEGTAPNIGADRCVLAIGIQNGRVMFGRWREA